MPDEDEGQEYEGEEGQEDEGTEGDENGEGGAPSADERWRNALPEEMRGLTPDAMGPAMATMWRTMEAQGRQLEAMSRAAPRHAQPEPRAEPEEEVNLKEMIFDDPEEAVARIFEKRFGGLVSNLQSGSSAGVFADARARFPGFAEREQKVKDLLAESGIGPEMVNPTVLDRAYKQVLGEEYSTTLSRKGTRTPSSERPTPTRERKNKAPKREFENDTERAIFQASGLNEDEYWALKDEDSTEMEVKTS